MTTARPARSRLRSGIGVLRRAALLLTILVLLGCRNPTGDDNGPVVIPSYVHGDGVPLDSAGIASWATGVGPGGYTPGVGAEAYTDPDAAVGTAAGSSTGVVVLGQGGSIVLDMGSPFADTSGADFAVWENGIAGAGGVVFVELAFVAVSSDGATFARFPVTARRTTPVEPFESVDPSLYDGFAGVHPLGTGTAFDLAELHDVAEVLSGEVDLGAVRYVKITDVVGGIDTDGNGRANEALHFDDQDPPQPIYDPFNTHNPGISGNTAGFDLDGVAVLR